MAVEHRVQVFVDDEGRCGSPLLVVTDAGEMSGDDRLERARTSGTSETVFVDDAASGRVQIYVPAGRIPFAGYPLIGTGWLLRRLGHTLAELHTDAGPVAVHADEGGCSIVTSPGLGNPWRLIEVPSTADLEALSSDGPDRHDYAWTWTDQAAGHVRARAFASSSGSPEDEATGAAAIELCARLGRDLTIVQGQGSLIRVGLDGDLVRLSGRVAAPPPLPVPPVGPGTSV